jgi:hypothetical protein
LVNRSGQKKGESGQIQAEKEIDVPIVMNKRVILAFALSSFATVCLCGASSTNDWYNADEGSFTFQIPKLLAKQVIHPIDSHCGRYSSPTMQLDFDEVHGLGYTKKEALERQSKFEAEYGSQKDSPNKSHFIIRLAKRYASVDIGADEKWIKWQYPGKYAVEFFCPDPAGRTPGYLSILVTFKNQKDTDKALSIIESVKFSNPSLN